MGKQGTNSPARSPGDALSSFPGSSTEAVIAFALGFCPTPEARLIARWTSSSAELFRVGRPGAEADDVVVKRTSSAEVAAVAFKALVRLAQVVDAAACADAATIRPLGLDRALPALAMPYVPGATLGQLLRSDPSQLRPLLGRVAAIMARLHEQSRPESEEAASALATAQGGLARARRRDGPAVEPSVPLDPSDIVRRTMAYNPNNMVLHPDGRIWLIDPPVRAVFASFHHDIAQFLYKCHKRLVIPPWNVDRLQVAWDFSGSVRYFLERYFTECSRPMREADAELVSTFLTSFSRSGSSRDSRYFKVMQATMYGPLLRRRARSTGSDTGAALAGSCVVGLDDGHDLREQQVEAVALDDRRPQAPADACPDLLIPSHDLAHGLSDR